MFLYGCASPPSVKEQAVKLTENGLCKDALSLWDKAVTEAPADMDAKIGQKKCRDQIIQENLISVRNLRLSSNEREALYLLVRIKNQMMSWESNLDFNSSSFLAKETNALWSFWKNYVDSLLEQKKVLKASLLLKQYSYIFSTISDFSYVETKINATGLSFCDELILKSNNKPYLSEFSSKVCEFYGNKNYKTMGLKSNDLYYKIYPDFLIDKMGSFSRNSLNLILEESFKKTPWFNPNADKQLFIVIKGNLIINKGQVEDKKSKKYYVEIPYFEKIAVSKSKQVPYFDTEMVCNQFGQNYCTSQYVQKYRTEYYTDYETVKKYRDEERFFNYKVLTSIQNIELKVETSFSVKNTIIFPYYKKFYEEKISHNHTHELAGISPENEVPSDEQVVLNNFFSEIGDTFQNYLNKEWATSFCTQNERVDFYENLESILKCKKSPLHDKIFVDSWVIKNLGVSNQELSLLIK